MGTPFAVHKRLTEISDTLEALAEDLVLLLIENYKDELVTLGSSNSGSEIHSCFSLTDSEFENTFLHLYYSGSAYMLELERINTDTPHRMTIVLDDFLCDKLPKELKEDLQGKYDELFNESFER